MLGAITTGKKELVNEVICKIAREHSMTNNSCHYVDISNYEKSLQKRYGLPNCKDRYEKQLLEQNKLYETLIDSYSYSILCEKLKTIGCNILRVRKRKFNCYIYAEVPNDVRKKINQLLLKCGWYVKNDKTDTIVLAPRFFGECTDYVYKNKGGILYHTTPLHNLRSIMRYGLWPHCGRNIDLSKDFLLLMPHRKETIENAVPSLAVADSKRSDVYIQFQIDLSLLPESYLKPRFFMETNVGDYITFDNIPPCCLRKLDLFKI